MGKPPSNTPSVGDRVKLRGRDARGELRSVTELNWATVKWDVDGSAPMIVHLHELTKEA